MSLIGNLFRLVEIGLVQKAEHRRAMAEPARELALLRMAAELSGLGSIGAGDAEALIRGLVPVGQAAMLDTRDGCLAVMWDAIEKLGAPVGEMVTAMGSASDVPPSLRTRGF